MAIRSAHSGTSLRERLCEEAGSTGGGSAFVPGLTGLRALAALLVLLHHLFALAGPRILSWSVGEVELRWHWLLTTGWAGANMFFVLSGFLLAIPFLQQAPAPVSRAMATRYAWRRIQRVAPAYWSQVLLLTGLASVMATFPGWGLVGAHLLFLQNIRFEWSIALNGVYWTLPTEFGFYLILPALAMLAWGARRLGSKAWLVIAVAMIACAIAWRLAIFDVVSSAPVSLRFFSMLQLPGVLDHFGIGIAFAWLHARREFTQPSPAQADFLAAAGLAGIVVSMRLIDSVYPAYWDGHPVLFFGYTLIASFIGLLVYGTARGGRLTQWLFANPPMLFLGIISYSLYLWHLPVLLLVMRYLDRGGEVGDRLGPLLYLALPLSIAVAALSYLMTERPFLPKQRDPTVRHAHRDR